jgi:hypothetical protein
MATAAADRGKVPNDEDKRWIELRIQAQAHEHQRQVEHIKEKLEQLVASETKNAMVITELVRADAKKVAAASELAVRSRTDQGPRLTS